MAIGKKLRFEVFKRDAFRCQYCGRTPPTVTLEADHILAESKGGESHIDNLITSCMDCNQGKGAHDLEKLPETLSVKAQIAIEREEQLRAYSEAMMAIRKRKEADANAVDARWSQLLDLKYDDGLKEGKLTSVRMFLEHLALPDVLEAVDIAFSKVPPVSGYQDEPTWKYFCGICWRRIKRARGEDARG